MGFLAVGLVDDLPTAAQWARRFRFQMAVAAPQGPVLDKLDLNTAPSTLFVDRQGVIIGVAKGEQGQRFIEARAGELLRGR